MSIQRTMLGNSTHQTETDITINRNTPRVQSTGWKVRGQWHVILERDGAAYLGTGRTLAQAFWVATQEAGL